MLWALGAPTFLLFLSQERMELLVIRIQVIGAQLLVSQLVLLLAQRCLELRVFFLQGKGIDRLGGPAASQCQQRQHSDGPQRGSCVNG
jgi:hypothetical protein